AFVGGSDVYLQKHDDDGNLILAAKQLFSGLGAFAIEAAASEQGLVVLATTSGGAGPDQVYYQTFDPAGQATSGELALPPSRTESETFEATAAGPAAYVAAEDDSETAFSRITLRRILLADGAVSNQPLTPPTVDALCPSLAVTGDKVAVSYRAFTPGAIRQLVFVDR
ncbi:MAG: hypothetical protein KJO07_19850, partial [Deltaproteobacteria bacterium]|nr:hypothetical protein [Deltaproteobacteria bacterium]